MKRTKSTDRRREGSEKGRASNVEWERNYSPENSFDQVDDTGAHNGSATDVKLHAVEGEELFERHRWHGLRGAGTGECCVRARLGKSIY